MLFDFALPEHDRKLLPEGRFSGPMPWVIAIMMFLTLLASAAGLVMAATSALGGAQLAHKATVQILEADPASRTAKRDAAVRLLRTQSIVRDVAIVPDQQVRSLLQPWLGDGAADADIPVPALIDIELSQSSDAAQIGQLRNKLHAISPNIRVDSHASWMAPFYNLMHILIALCVAILMLLLVAMGATIYLAVRSSLNTHVETLEIMHLMGGTDLQAARLFQRRVAIDSLQGSLLGFIAAALVIIVVSSQMDDVQSSLFSSGGFPWYGWPILAILPIAIMFLATYVARHTVVAALKKML